MLSIFSRAFWPSVCLLWRNVYLDLLHFFFFLIGWFFLYWTEWAVCIFWRLVLCGLLHLQILSPILWTVFLFMVSFAVQKHLSFIRSHLFLDNFFFWLHCEACGILVAQPDTATPCGGSMVSQWLDHQGAPMLSDNFFFLSLFILVDLQYYFDFCHTSTWIKHRCTYVSSLLNLPPSSNPFLPL